MPTSRLPPPGMPPTEPSGDRDLVVRASGGDRAAWGALYARYADRLFDYAARLTGNRAQAADCVQDAFVLAVERIGQLRDPDKVRPWLYAIVRSTAHRHYRLANRFSMQDVPDLPTDGSGGSNGSGGDDMMLEGVTDRELAELLEEAAKGLTDEDREVLDLSLRHDLSPADVAAALGVSSRHAAVTTERMRERLGRSVVVTVLARRPDCEEFAAMKLAEGPLNPLSRKRLARHVDSCATCAAQRDRQVRPEVLLGALPLLLIPRRAFADFEPLLDEALRRLQSGAEPADGGLEWDEHGFPVNRSARRARWLPWTAAALVGLLAGGGIVGWAARDGARGSTMLDAGSTTVITAAPLDVATTTVVASSPVASSPVTLPPTSAPAGAVLPESIDSVARPLNPTSSPATETTLPADTTQPVTTTRPTTPTTRPPTTTPVATTPTVTTAPLTTGPATTSPPTSGPATTAPATTTTTAPTTTTTTAPDTTGPTIGSSTASPTNIGTVYNGIGYCNQPPAYTTPYATTSAFTVAITDPSGVVSATFSWSAGSGSGGGSLLAGGGGGGTWSATLGPVQSADVPLDGGSEASASMSVTITATDALGHVSSVTRTGVVTVHNCSVIL